MIDSNKREESRKNLLVRRITIDEILSGELMRILVSSLGKSGEFSDKDFEAEEEETFATPEDYIEIMGVTYKRRYPWTYFEEGQVFLSGHFKVLKRGSKKKPLETYKAGWKIRRNFRRIDWSVKKTVKELYEKALVWDKSSSSRG